MRSKFRRWRARAGEAIQATVQASALGKTTGVLATITRAGCVALWRVHGFRGAQGRA
jgi:hypothetical protein